MTGRSPGIALGHRVHYDGRDWLVAELRGSQVTLTQPAGEVCAVLLTHLVGADDFELLDVPRRIPVASEALLEGVDAGELARARRIEAHILQVDHGCLPGGEAVPTRGMTRRRRRCSAGSRRRWTSWRGPIWP